MGRLFYISLMFVCWNPSGFSQVRPNLILTQSGVEKINSQKYPVLFEKVLYETKARVDLALSKKMEVPVPKDMGGGYTHEKHKSNYRVMQEAGALYQITRDEKYAAFIKEMLSLIHI